MALKRAILGLRSIYPTAWCQYMCKLLVTGQTTQYSSKEDDGYHQKGLSNDYTVLSTGDYSGTVAIVLNAKTHNLSNNCVVDNRTGLMWARYVPNADIGPDNNGKLFWIDDTNDEDIFDFKDQANTKQLGGHDDWRVPNAFELFSLMIHEGGGTPYIDTTTFPSTPADMTWTSTTRPDSTDNAMRVHFGNASVYSAEKTTLKYYCRLVRSGG